MKAIIKKIDKKPKVEQNFFYQVEVEDMSFNFDSEKEANDFSEKSKEIIKLADDVSKLDKKISNKTDTLTINYNNKPFAKIKVKVFARLKFNCNLDLDFMEFEFGKLIPVNNFSVNTKNDKNLSIKNIFDKIVDENFEQIVGDSLYKQEYIVIDDLNKKYNKLVKTSEESDLFFDLISRKGVVC